MYVLDRSDLHEPRSGHGGSDGGAAAEGRHRLQQGRVPLLRQLQGQVSKAIIDYFVYYPYRINVCMYCMYVCIYICV